MTRPVFRAKPNASSVPDLPAKTARVPGMKGTLPHAPGKVLISDDERRVLEKGGWREGDPLPEQGANAWREAQQVCSEVFEDIEDACEELSRKPRKPFVPPPEVDIEDLSEEEQQKLTAQIAEAQKMFKRQKASPTLSPGMSKVITEMEAEERHEQARATFKPKRTPKAAKKAPEEAPKESAESEAVAGALPTQPLGKCPHCDRLLSVEPIKTTAEDELQFALANLAAEGGWFHKTYGLFGGRFQVTFRNLTIEHANMALHQCAVDVKKGRIENSDLFAMRLLDYRMILSMESLIVNDDPIELADSVADYLKAWKVTDEDTALFSLLEQIQKMAPLNREGVWRPVALRFREFSRLVDAIESRADHQNFSRAIDG